MYFYPTCVNTEKKVVKISTNFRLHTLYLTYVLKQKIDKATANLFWGYFLAIFFSLFKTKKWPYYMI